MRRFPTAVPVTAEVREVEFYPLESDALKLIEEETHLMSQSDV